MFGVRAAFGAFFESVTENSQESDTQQRQRATGLLLMIRRDKKIYLYNFDLVLCKLNQQ